MKTLIVFEDMYGISDIFKAVVGIDYDPMGMKEPVQINNEFYAIAGLNNRGCLGFRSDMDLYLYEYDMVICVFDIDRLGNSSKNCVISKQEFISLTTRAKSRVNARIMYMPVVYNSETVMLHQYLFNSGDLDVVDLAHKDDTYKLHLNLLQELVIVNTGRKRANIKRVEEYLDFTKLMRGYKCSKSNVDRHFKRWLLSYFNLDLKYFITSDEVIDLLAEAQSHLDKQISYNRRYVQVNKDCIIDMTTEGAIKPILLR